MWRERRPQYVFHHERALCPALAKPRSVPEALGPFSKRPFPTTQVRACGHPIGDCITKVAALTTDWDGVVSLKALCGSCSESDLMDAVRSD